MLLQEIKCGVCVLLLYQSEFTMPEILCPAKRTRCSTRFSWFFIFICYFVMTIKCARPVDEWALIVFSARQDPENKHCETLNKPVNKLNFLSLDMLIHFIRGGIRGTLLDQSVF